jgi:hypothetical protein
MKDVQATEEAFRLKIEHPALQNKNFFTFQFLWVIYALLDQRPNKSLTGG